MDFEAVSAGSTGASVTLIESGDVDAGFYAEPLGFAEPERFETTWNSADYVPLQQSTLMVVTESFAAENPEIVDGMRRGYQDAVDWMRQNQAEAVEILAPFVESSPEIIAPFLEFYLESDGWSVELTTEAMDASMRVLRALQGVEAEIPWDELISSEFLPDFVPPAG